MDETTFLRNLLKFRHVRKSDFHQPPTRKDRKKLLSDGTIDNNGGGITKVGMQTVQEYTVDRIVIVMLMCRVDG